MTVGIFITIVALVSAVVASYYVFKRLLSKESHFSYLEERICECVNQDIKNTLSTDKCLWVKIEIIDSFLFPGINDKEFKTNSPGAYLVSAKLEIDEEDWIYTVMVATIQELTTDRCTGYIMRYYQDKLSDRYVL